MTFLVLAVCLAGCNRGSQDKEAVRQGILDRLQAKQMSIPSMGVDLKSVTFQGKKAQATVSIYPKNLTPADGMVMTYNLEQQGSKWVVTDRKDAGGMPHGGTAPPGSAMPQGGAMPGGAMPPSSNPHGGAVMPSPNDLPPAGAKK